jgi:hypothetical protein
MLGYCMVAVKPMIAEAFDSRNPLIYLVELRGVEPLTS